MPSSHTLVDAAWLLQVTNGDMYVRGDKLEQLAFGQRVFSRRPASDSDAIAAILRELPGRRMLLSGLERVGVTDPALFALALRQARAAGDGGGDRFWTMAQLQGAMALVLRMHVNRVVTDDEASTLLRALYAIPLDGGEFRGGLVRWIESDLATHLPRVGTWQTRIVAGLAGGPTPGEPLVEWEGLSYRLDLAFTERRRIEEIQSHQDGPDIDAALAIARLARRAVQTTAADDGRSLAAEAQQLLAAYGLTLARPPNNVLAPNVPVPRDGRDWLQRVADDFERGARTGDVRRITRAGESLVQLGDIALGHAMLSLVYAMHLGDPGGPALLGGNVALRHDFGLGRREGDSRTRGPWSQPRQDFQPGVPWHVVGSLVGLDVGLAPLSLRRLSMDTLPEPPRLQSIEREAFGVNVALLNPRLLTDADRDRVVNAIRRGRARVRALEAGAAESERVKTELAFDGWRARTFNWVLQNEPRSMENQFSLAELVWLGDPGAAFDTWGGNALLSYACVCTRFPVPGLWRILAGRTQQAMLAAATVEMNLEMAQRLSALRLPAALLPSVLSTAMQHYVDRVPSVDPSDDGPLSPFARALPDDLVADFIAGAATLDGPLVSIEQDETEH
ncbi:MAG: hypothetical protein QM736_11180 [Vicinamibacterales bacterium]